MSLTATAINAIELGLVPDWLTRAAIVRLCRKRLAKERARLRDGSMDQFIDQMRTGPIAQQVELANEQHYELPAGFFELMLGPRLKYSCCHFDNDSTTLAEAEESALSITCDRSGIVDGDSILELGCGWGSLTLFMAERFPASQITAVSNSSGQRLFIQQRCRERGLANVQVLTADINELDPSTTFDRVVSVEMFEHMRNYELLLSRIAAWLKPDGKLFVHVFCHRELVYPFEADGAANWMGRYFFSGGLMPSSDLFHRFDRDLAMVKQHQWNGGHYARTLDAWLARLDARREKALRLLTDVYGQTHDDGAASRWFHRWRMFLMACSELFAFADGEEWFVIHCLLERRQR